MPTGSEFFSVEILVRKKAGEISARQHRRLCKIQVIPGVTVGAVNSARGRTATMHHFNKNTREDLNRDVNDKAIAQYILHNRKIKAAQEQTEAIVEDQTVEIDQALVQDRVQQKLGKYLQAFAAETPNDLFKLRQVCSLEAQIELIDEALMPLSASGAGEKRVDELFKRRNDLNKQYLDMEKSLQLDPKGRAESEGSRKASDIIRDTLLQFREFLADNILQVFHCNTLVAWIWHGFPTHPWRAMIMQCPVCGREFPVAYPPKWRDRAVSQDDFMKGLDLDEIDMMIKRGLFAPEEEAEVAGPDMVM